VAKKSRTPAPPRAVQAPKRRSEPRKPGRTRIWIAAALGALVLAGVAGGAYFAFGGDDEGGGAAGSDACTVQTLKAQGQGHVDKLPKDFKPNSYPRVTGPHSPQTVIYGEYDQSIDQLQVVHNLEHGAVVVQWGPGVSEETVNAIRAWYRTDARGKVIAPLPENDQSEKLRGKITLAAWVAELEDEDDPTSEITKQEGMLATCSRFDEDFFNSFVEDYGARGPERFTLEDMAPGSG
jgi:hypothetical protein